MLFCDIFSIPEPDRLPASFVLLHSFCLWAAADPDPADLALADGTLFEPVSAGVAGKYTDAVRAWHLAQGWPAPLSEDERDRITRSLRGLAAIQAERRTRPPRPPVTLHMLAALRASLNIAASFEACVWAIAACAFWGLIRFGEATVKSRGAFNGSIHLKRRNALFGTDLLGTEFARLDLPRAKTSAPGEVQHVFLVGQPHLCPLAALRNLAAVVPAAGDDPLFSWRDDHGNIRPMVRDAVLKQLNAVFGAWGFGTA